MVFWGLLTLPDLAFAAPLLPAARFHAEHIGVGDGLTQGSVYFMLKDSRGFMWFGTQDGLNCYDGHRFLPYRPDPHRPGSIRGVNIFGIVEDKDNTIWVGTEEGLNRYDRRKNQFTCFYTSLPRAGLRPTPSRTLPFYADQKELLYLSDDEGLVSVDYHTRQKRILHRDLKPKHEYDLQSSTTRSPAGDVWLHAPTGLVRYNLLEKKLHRYFSTHPANEFGQSENVFSFHIDAQDIVWIGTASGLIRFDYKTGATHTFSMAGETKLGPIYSLAEDQEGRLWVGTQQQGLFYFDKRSCLFGTIGGQSNSAPAISQFEINKILVDNQGIIWANIDPNGLVKLVPELFTFSGLSKNYQSSPVPADQRLSNYIIRGFAEFAVTDADKALSKPPIWVGTESGINVLDQSSWRVLRRYLTSAPRSNFPMHNPIKRLYVDSYRRMWVGTIGGAYLFHPRDESFELVSFAPTHQAGVVENFARDLVAISADTLIAATEDGIFQLSLAKRQWRQRPELANETIFSFHWEAATRRLWVGTYLNGFCCYQLPPDGSTAPWRRLTTGLVGYTVLRIHDDPARNTVWLSTDRGLAALNRHTSKIRLYTERDGLANSFIYGVLPDNQNNLWMSTNRGISRLDVANAQVKNFSLADGLQGLEFNGNALYRTQDGMLLFGGVNGFNSCQPDLYRLTRTNPPVHLYNLRVNDADELFITDAVLNETTLELDYAQNTFSLEFAAIDYLSNTHNRYSYMLSNYDEDWVDAGEKNYVRYANVPPGDYVLHVRAANKDGQWSRRVHQLTIQINEPFWRTVPFMLAVILVISWVIFWWVRRRESLLRDRQAEQLQLAYDVQEQVKRAIAQDLHDEIGTRLATLKLYTSQIARYVGNDEAPRNLRNAINGLINDTISDVRDLLRELNPRTLDQYGFGPALEELLERINATGGIEAHVSLDTDLMRLPSDVEIMLYRIVQELINNTLKHAGATQIDITCRYREDRIYLTYADNGKGFNYERVQQGLGIGNIESRVAMLQGTIQWQNEHEKGTSVIIVLPTPSMDKKVRQSPAKVNMPSPD